MLSRLCEIWSTDRKVSVQQLHYIARHPHQHKRGFDGRLNGWFEDSLYVRQLFFAVIILFIKYITIIRDTHHKLQL